MQKATEWIAVHSPEDIRLQIDKGERMPGAEADRAAIRSFEEVLSRDGRMAPEGPEIVRKLMAASDSKIRTTRFDMSKLYSNPS